MQRGAGGRSRGSKEVVSFRHCKGALRRMCPSSTLPFPLPNAQRAVQRLRLFGVGVGADFPSLKPVVKQQARPAPPRPPPPAAYADPKEERRRRRRSRYEHEGLYEAQHHGHDDELLLASPFRAEPNSSSSSSIGGEGPSWYLDRGSSAPDPGSIGASPGYMQAAAQRYGWRGVDGLRSYHVGRMATPPRRSIPAVLRDGGVAVSDSDTWTPKLSQHSSPAHWPGNGEYVEGYKAKEYSISYIYNRETTVNDAQQPLPDVRLQRMRQREDEEQRMLQAGIQAERRERVAAAAAAAAEAAVGAVTLEARRSSRCSVVDEGNGEDDAKWQALEGVHDMLLHYQSLARLRSVELEGLAVCLQLHCFGGEGATLVTREGFVDALMGRYGSRLLHEHNIKPDILFSLCRNSSQLRVVCFVEVVAMLIVLDEEMDVRCRRGGALLQGQRSRPTVERTLVRLFRLYQRHRSHCNVTENINALFVTCSRNAHEAAEMTALLRREFLPYCYRVAALQTISSPAGASSPRSSSSTAPAAVARGATAVRFRVKTPFATAAVVLEGGARRTGGGDPLLIYNICNGVFREQDFERALAVHPRVVRLFQDQMTRVQACAVDGAGTDSKRGGASPIGAEEEEQEEEKEETEQKQRGEGKEGGTRKKKDVGSILGNLFPRKEKKPMQIQQ